VCWNIWNLQEKKMFSSDSTALHILFLILPNTDHLQQVEDYVRGCTWQLKKVKTAYMFHKLFSLSCIKHFIGFKKYLWKLNLNFKICFVKIPVLWISFIFFMFNLTDFNLLIKPTIHPNIVSHAIFKILVNTGHIQNTWLICKTPK